MALNLNMIILEQLLCVLYVYLLRNKIESSGGWWYSTRKEIHATRRITLHSENWLDLERWLLTKYLTLKASSICFIEKFKKFNMIWQVVKEVLTNLKSWWRLQRLLFFFGVITTCWRRKLYLLFPVIDQWIKVQGSRSISSNGNI